jgi:hypothetical protein
MMTYEQLVATINFCLEKDDANLAWDLQDEIGEVWNSLPPNSPEREVLADLWKKMMNKWH